MTPTRSLAVTAADGLGPLAAVVHEPARAPIGIAVVVHPHPGWGGNKDVPLIRRVAEQLAGAGWVALRLDLRSAGAADALEADGFAERDDVAGALEVLRDLTPAVARQALVGWSFGAIATAHHGLRDPAVTDWVGIGPPTRPIDGVPVAEVPDEGIAQWTARRAVVVGAVDQHFPPQTMARWHPRRLTVVPGGDHGLAGLEDEVAAAVVDALDGGGPAAAPS